MRFKSTKPHNQLIQKRQTKPRSVRISVFIITFAFVGGIIFLLITHASNPTISLEVEHGTIVNPAAIGNDSKASGGQYVLFGNGSNTTYGTPTHPFAATAPINVLIPSNPKYALNNGAVNGLVADITQFGFPLYVADATTPRVSVHCKLYCSPGPYSSVPLPTGLKTSTGSDAAAAIVDAATGDTYEFWQMSQNGSNWQVNGAGFGNITGTSIIGNATGSNISLFAGTATLTDLASGVIQHALNFAIGTTCSGFKYPATKSDGHGLGNGCIPEGARVQLDPTVNLSALPGITPFELMVGKALQRYGAYCADTGGSGSSMAIRFEDPVDISVTGQLNYYNQNGIPDYYQFPRLNALPAIDWKILNSWNGQ